MTTPRTLAFLLGAAGLVGCSGADGPNKYPVSGTVRLGDRPITGGFVVIEPADGGAGGGLQGVAPIRDGRFDTEAGGKRAVAGPVVLRIDGWGEPTAQFKNGVPLCNRHEIRVTLKPAPNELDLVVPESARVKEPKGGWGALP